MEEPMARILTRDTERAVVAGVAAGFARYFDVDPVVARLAFVVLAFLHGVGIILYAICWVIVPKGSEDPSSGTGGSPTEARGAPASGGATPADRFADEVKVAGERVVESMRKAERDPGRGQIIAGVFLLAIGLLFLASRLDLWYWPRWLNLWDLWPVVLIVIGASMILRPRRGTR